MPHTENNPQMPRPAIAKRSHALHGSVTVAGDKSISHRALMLASQALGTTRIHGLLEGEDVLATAAALRLCGVPITRHADGVWEVSGVGIGGLAEPADVLDMGNAGTSARLMMGLLAPYPFHVQFSGDASLRKRPMQRVITPLEQMGAQFWAREGGRLPLAMQGAAMPMPITYALPVASAQVKSAILLAGLNTPGATTVIEQEATRDHTERMLQFFGVRVEAATQQDGATAITLHGQPQQTYQDRSFSVPADPSSAAFPLVAAVIVPGSDITLTGVCLNPTRIGLLTTLQEMGADITVHNERMVAGEPVGDITARYAPLSAITVPAARAPSMIDEYPILAIAAACAQGKTVMRGVGELRVKESNRLAAIIAGLHACGVDAIEEGDDLIVFGRGKAPRGGGTVTTHYDHRMAMSFLILGLVSEEAVIVDDTRAIATSFPNFMRLMEGLGAEIADVAPPRKEIPAASGGVRGRYVARTIAADTLHPTSPAQGEEPAPPATRRLVIAVDGPAASGKGTLARRLADHFGLPYLDTGSLYRAVGMRVIYANQSPEDVAAAIAAARALQPHDLANPKLRTERIGKAASIVSAIPEVRQALFDYQRHFAANAAGAVLDGRDIGTVICPDADIKFFITASLEARAKRRHKELQEYGVTVDYQSVCDELAARDARDATRAAAPMIAAEDAHAIDTSHLGMNEVFDKALEMIAALRR